MLNYNKRKYVINFNNILKTNSIIPDHNSEDDPRRLELNESFWKTLIHFQEKNKLDSTLQQKVQSYFEDHYAIRDKTVFLTIWDKIGAKVWSPKDPLTAGTIRAIDATFREKLIYHGKGIKPPEHQPPLNQTVHRLVQALLHGDSFSPRQIEEREVKAIFIEHDELLMEQFQQEMQREMDHLSANPPPLMDTKQEIVWRAFLGNILALIPYTYPTTNTVFRIPILENDVCRLVDYRTEVISLGYEDHLTPMTALAMTPMNDRLAPPILSFIGTTFPAGSGFTATLLADFTPGNSVGEIVYKKNHQKIDDWLAKNHGAHVVGMSLGGAMAFHTLRHHHSEINRVDVYNPPGLYPKNWEKGIGKTCNVNIYCQPNDIVSQLGEWPTGKNVSLYTVYPHHEGLPEDPLNAHARAYTGCENITIIKENPKEENQSFFRYFLTKMHQYLGPFFIYFPLNCMIVLYRVAKAVQKVSVTCFDTIRNTFKSR